MPICPTMQPVFSCWLLRPLVAQQPASQPAPAPTTAAEAPNRDTSYIDAQGTAHMTRVVPVPQGPEPAGATDAGPAGAGPGPAAIAGRAPQNDGRVYGARPCGMEQALPQHAG